MAFPTLCSAFPNKYCCIQSKHKSIKVPVDSVCLSPFKISMNELVKKVLLGSWKDVTLSFSTEPPHVHQPSIYYDFEFHQHVV